MAYDLFCFRDDLREHLKNAPKKMIADKLEASSSDSSDSDSSDSDSSNDSDSSGISVFEFCLKQILVVGIWIELVYECFENVLLLILSLNSWHKLESFR